MADTVSTQAQTVIVNPYSGDYRIDVLLPSATARWNSGSPVGTAATVTYSFMSAAPTYAQASDRNGFSVFNAEQMGVTRQILTMISQQVGITFQEVTDTSSNYGTLRFGNNAQGQTSAGYATYPDINDRDSAGDMYINNQSAENLSNITPGQNSWATLVHEIGHTLGLKHPGNYNAGESASSTPDNFLAAAEDTEATTIMSYVKTPQRQERDFFGPYDLLALKYLYGSVAYNATNTSISYDNSAGQKLLIINDTGGTDTIDVSAVSLGVNINLTPGAASSVGVLANGTTAALNNVSLAYDALIENVIGTALDDTLKGNTANNSLTGGVGNDNLDGAAGTDTAAYSGARATYTVTKTTTGHTVQATTGTDGVDTLANIERLQFSDTKLALDLDGNAGTTAKVLGSVFGAAAVANKQFVGIGLGLLDGGTTYAGLMQLALTAAGATSNAQVVNLLWTNLFGSAPSADQAAPFVALLQNGSSTPGALGVLAADLSLNTNNINLVGLQQTGLEYS